MAEQYFLSSDNAIGIDGGMRFWVKPGSGGDGGGPTTLTAIGYWAATDPWLNTTGDTVRDSAGFPEDQRSGVGTARTLQPGRANNFFNSNYVNVGDTLETVKSISFWVKPDAILARTDGCFRINTTVASNVTIVNGTVTVDHPGGTDKIRVNDVDTAIIANTTAWHHVYIEFTTAHDLEALFIGREATAFMDGKMFDCRFYSRVLGPAEITALKTQGDTPQYLISLPDDHEVGYYLDECFTADNGAYQNGSTTNIVGNDSEVVLDDVTMYYEGNDVPYSIQNLHGYTLDLDFLSFDPDDIASTGGVIITPRVAGEDLVMTGATTLSSIYWVRDRIDSMFDFVSIESTSIGFGAVVSTPLYTNVNGSQSVHVPNPNVASITKREANGGGQALNKYTVSAVEALVVTEWILRMTCPLPLLASDRTVTAIKDKGGIVHTPIPAQFTGVCSKPIPMTDLTPPDSDTKWINPVTDTDLNITTGEITMFGWVWADDHSVRNIAGEKNNCYRFLDVSATSGNIGIYVGTGGSKSLFTPMGVLPTGRWVHVLWTYEQSAGRMEMWFDGHIGVVKNNVTGKLLASNTDPYYPNSFDATASFGWFGGMCGMGIMDRIITLDEVRDLYHNNILPATGVVSYLPTSEGGGVNSYNHVLGTHTTWTGEPDWGTNGLTAGHNFNTIHGCSLYEHATLANMYVPYGDDGSPLSITPPTGYTKTADYPAVIGINTNQVALNFNPEPLAPWTRKSASIPTAWVKGDGAVSGLTVDEAAGVSNKFKLGDF